jgi:sugar-specific transcriptional regulator TrmB
MSFIERLELTLEEKQVYTLLLGSGQLTAFEIAQFGNLHFSKVQVAIDALQKKGAVGVSEGYLEKYFVRIPLEYLAESSDQISASVKNNLTNTSTFMESKKTEFNELRTNLVTQLNESVSRKEAELDQKLAVSSSELEDMHNQKKEFIASKSSEIKRELSTIQDEQKQNLTNFIQETLQNNTDSISSAKSSIDSVEAIISQKNTENASTSSNQVDQNVNQTLTSIEEIFQTLKPKLELLGENYSAHIGEIPQLLEESVDLTKIDVRTFNKSQTDKNLRFSTETVRTTGETVDKISETVSSSLNELNSSLEMLLNRKVEELSLQVQEAVSALNDKVSEIKQSLSDELIQQKNLALSNTVSQIKEDMNLKYTNLQNSEQIHRNNLTSERDMFAQKLDAQYNETLQNYNNKIQEIQETARTRLSNFEENFSTQFSDIVTGIVDNLNNHVQSFRDLSTKLNENINRTLGTETDNLKEKWSDLTSQMQAIAQENEVAINSKYQEAVNLINSSTSAISSELSTYLDQSLESTRNITTDIITTSKAQITDSKNQLAGNLTEEVDAAARFLAETEGKFTDTANHLLTVAMKLKNDFRTLEATTRESPIPRVETTSITGLEATKDHMDRIVRAAKRSVTIMSPNPDYISLDAVKSLPSTVRVTIVTKLDETINREWIDSAYTAEANVEVRKFRDVGTGVELPKFIGVERENEEVLIGAVDEATNEVVGILSSSTEFAKIVSYIVIADFARGRSTQIK